MKQCFAINHVDLSIHKHQNITSKYINQASQNMQTLCNTETTYMWFSLLGANLVCSSRAR